MDAGGPVGSFSVTYSRRIKGEPHLFEGPPTRLYPVYSSFVLTSGMLIVLGRITLLQEGPGFPFLNPFVFLCLVTENAEIAVNYVDVNDLK